MGGEPLAGELRERHRGDRVRLDVVAEFFTYDALVCGPMLMPSMTSAQ